MIERLVASCALAVALLLASAPARAREQVTPILQEAYKAASDGVLWAAPPTMQPALMLVVPYCKYVNVQVEVAPDGTVVATRLVDADTPFFLVRVTLAAAALWRFDPAPIKRELTISFALAGEKVTDEEPPGLTARYENPFTVRLQYITPLTERLKRLDGRVPEQRCKVHGRPMDVAVVPIRYGLTMNEYSYPEPERRMRETYWKALERHFPNAPEWRGAGCIVQPQTQEEVYVCPRCKELKQAWLTAHPGFTP